VEPVGSLPHSQEPTTCQYLEVINTVHALPPHSLKIYFTVILPSIPKSSKWSLSFRFPTKTLCAPLP